MDVHHGNLLAAPTGKLPEELISTLLESESLRLERILSTGQRTADGQWYDQEQDEWVVLLRGRARLQIVGEPEPRQLAPGDWVLLPAHCRHRVDWTDPNQASIWLALHYDATPSRPHR
jgi:cupin 2 domain-containing protein